MGLADSLMAAAGHDPRALDAVATVPLGRDPAPKRARARAVAHTPELDRVLSLPRRLWWRGLGDRWGTAEAVRDLLTEHLRVPDPADPGARLHVHQSAALQEIYDFGGALVPVPVGGGKTLISLLTPVVVGAERPLLLVRANLREKTLRERDEYALDWRVPPVVQRVEDWGPGTLLVLSYDSISRDHMAAQGEELDEAEARGRELLGLFARIEPDLVLADEVQAFRNPRSRRTRCTDRFVRARRRAEGAEGGRHGSLLRFVGMTGTLTKRSLRDYAHLADWALGPGAPLPRRWDVLTEWADAIDEGVDARPSPGALARLCDETEQGLLLTSPLEACRRAFGRRLVQSPGVIAVAEGYDIDARLVVRALHHQRGPDVEEALACVRERWETPGGEPFAEVTEQWRHARTVACGFYQHWVEQPPDEWLEARRAWCAFARETLRTNRRGLDTELQVANACDRGDLPAGELLRWREVKASFKPRTEAVWVSDEALELAAAWLEAHPAGIAWVHHIEAGRRLAEVAGVPYFGATRRRSASSVEDHEGPCVVSIDSNKEGRNLQHRWRDNLVLEMPKNGAEWEQVLGRTHRYGQEAPIVSVDVFLSCHEQLETFLKHVADASFIEQTTTTRQKLLYGDVSVSAPDPEPKNW